MSGLPLAACLALAESHGAATAIIETRYIDPDYRSEYSAYFAKTFLSVPDAAHRIHFFRGDVATDEVWRLSSQHRRGYLGYIVVRPSPVCRVGRTMLPPPRSLGRAVRTAVTERVNLFGNTLRIRAVPFVQQDTQLGRCAHAAAWICHYTAHLKGDVSRKPMADFSLLAKTMLGTGRLLPSPGLTETQTIELLQGLGLPPVVHTRDDPAEWDVASWSGTDQGPPADWESRITRLCCRYLNSGFPIIVNTDVHSFVLCGYERRSVGSGASETTFVRHDDQMGPYQVVADIADDWIQPRGLDRRPYSPWQSVIAPLPEKIWVTPESVEVVAETFFSTALLAAPRDAAFELAGMAARRQLTMRTYAIRSNEFKEHAVGRLPAPVARAYRLARMSRWVWVVEAVHKNRRDRRTPCVLGEVVFDATSGIRHPQPLAIHVPGYAMVGRWDPIEVRYPPAPYSTGGVGPC